ERVGGVQVAAEQEPGNEGPEAAPGQPPLVEVHHVLRATPARGGEPDPGDEDEDGDDDREDGRVDVAHRGPPSWVSSRRCKRVTTHSTSAMTGMKASR